MKIWEKEVDRITRLYEQTFEIARSKQGEFIWKEFGERPKLVLIGFLPHAEESGIIQQGFFERLEGSGIPRILAYLKNQGYSVAGCKIPLDDENSLNKLLETLKNKQSIKIVGISAFTFELDWAERVADKVRQFRADITLVFGGPHADTVNVNVDRVKELYGYENGWTDDNELKKLLKHFHHIAIGSGEIALENLLNQGEMSPVLKGGTPENVHELVSFLPPLRVLDDEVGIYPLPPDYIGLASFLGTEGCPYACTFCTSPLTCERTYRDRKESLPVLVREIKKHPANLIWFDNEISLAPWLSAFSDEIIKQGVQKHWVFMGRIDTFARQPECFLWKMKQAGCLQITYGVEAIDPQILTEYHKKISAELSNKILGLTTEAGIIPRAMMVIGSPNETQDTLNYLISWAKQSPALSFRFAYLVPFRGTPQWFEAERNNWWINEELKKSIHQTTAEPVIKCPAILNEKGEIDEQKLNKFRLFHRTALMEIYQSQEYHQKIVNFIKLHPKMALTTRGLIFLFEKQGLVTEGSFDQDCEDAIGGQ